MNGDTAVRTGLLIVGPIPPPYNGMTVFVETLLHSGLKVRFRLLHIDTIDHRRSPNMGRLNLSTLFLALRNIVRVCRTILGESPALVYLPISPTVLGLLRDSVFILESKILRRKVVIHLHGGRYIHTVYTQAPSIVRAIVRLACQSVERAIVLQDSFLDAFDGLIPSARFWATVTGFAHSAAWIITVWLAATISSGPSVPSVAW